MRIKSGTDHLDFSTDYQLWQMYCMQTGADQRAPSHQRLSHIHSVVIIVCWREPTRIDSVFPPLFFLFVIDVTITCFPIIPLCHTSTSSPSTSQWAGRDGFFFLPHPSPLLFMFSDRPRKI